jgi:hypothetical protein
VPSRSILGNCQRHFRIRFGDGGDRHTGGHHVVHAARHRHAFHCILEGDHREVRTGQHLIQPVARLTRQIENIRSLVLDDRGGLATISHEQENDLRQILDAFRDFQQKRDVVGATDISRELNHDLVGQSVFDRKWIGSPIDRSNLVNITPVRDNLHRAIGTDRTQLALDQRLHIAAEHRDTVESCQGPVEKGRCQRKRRAVAAHHLGRNQHFGVNIVNQQHARHTFEPRDQAEDRR